MAEPLLLHHTSIDVTHRDIRTGELCEMNRQHISERKNEYRKKLPQTQTYGVL